MVRWLTKQHTKIEHMMTEKHTHIEHMMAETHTKIEHMTTGKRTKLGHLAMEFGDKIPQTSQVDGDLCQALGGPGKCDPQRLGSNHRGPLWGVGRLPR